MGRVHHFYSLSIIFLCLWIQMPSKQVSGSRYCKVASFWSGLGYFSNLNISFSHAKYLNVASIALKEKGKNSLIMALTISTNLNCCFSSWFVQRAHFAWHTHTIHSRVRFKQTSSPHNLSLHSNSFLVVLISSSFQRSYAIALCFGPRITKTHPKMSR